MAIDFSFDDNEVKVDEPLGSVTISEGTERVCAQTVFLDSFFSALVNAYIQSSSGPVSIEVAEEGELVKIEREGIGLRVSYGKQKISFANASEFERSLRETCAELLSKFPEGASQNKLFDAVRAFVYQKRGEERLS
jgi:hypothetical protein